MVFGLVLGAASIPLAGGAVVTPTVTGIGKSVGSASGDKERDAERGKSCRLKVFCEGDSPAAHEVHGKYVGLTDDKVCVRARLLRAERGGRGCGRGVADCERDG